jgi:hypothetical protein
MLISAGSRAPSDRLGNSTAVLTLVCGAERTPFQEPEERRCLVGGKAGIHVYENVCTSAIASPGDAAAANGSPSPLEPSPDCSRSRQCESDPEPRAFVSLLSAPRGTVKKARKKGTSQAQEGLGLGAKKRHANAIILMKQRHHKVFGTVTVLAERIV